MGNHQEKLSAKPAARMSARELFPSGPTSIQHQNGRRLVLKFSGSSMPELDRIEFQGSATSKIEYRQRGDLRDKAKSFKRSPLTQALSMLLLDYLCMAFQTPPVSPVVEGGDGSSAATIGYALYDKNGKWGSLFVEYQNGNKLNRVEDVFRGSNWHGKPLGINRTVWINPESLPTDCIDIFWNNRPLKQPEQIRELAGVFRKQWKCPLPTKLQAESSPQIIQPPKPDVPKTELQSPDWLPQFGGCLVYDKVEGNPILVTEIKLPEEPKSAQLPQPQPAPKVDPALYEIKNLEGRSWDDNDQLIVFGNDDNEDDIWRIRDACEGLLVFGMPGSGKTSASGYLFGHTFLEAGFGGLVMTAKTDEARRWIRLCERFGRARDCVVINANSPHKLNFLAYESQRPGRRIAPSKDMVGFFTNMLNIVEQQGDNNKRDRFWDQSVKALLENLFEIFMLADEPVTINSIKLFVNHAPLRLTDAWQRIPYFGQLVQQAEAGSKKSPDDEDAFRRAHLYWTREFPVMFDATRSGIVTSFNSMAAVLQGRGIHKMISGETNITPESILSGKIVILDMAVKEDGDLGGLMIQSAWKFLFQRAIERRADKGRKSARPVFLWEDEGHAFFSKHDADFQPTCRDCRAAHIILSQNLKNFTRLGHSLDSVMAVFSSMNTHIFHCNGDNDTNKWASERIGSAIRTTKAFGNSTNSGSRNTRGEGNNPESGSSFSIHEQFQSAFKPESFQLLKKGSKETGTSEVVILWCGHPFKGNKGKPYCCMELDQDPERLPNL